MVLDFVRIFLESHASERRSFKQLANIYNDSHFMCLHAFVCVYVRVNACVFYEID